MWILKRRIRELFTHREGISTPHARHKERQPLIEWAKRDFIIIYFSFIIIIIIIFESTRVLTLLLRIPRCNEKIGPTYFFNKNTYIFFQNIHFKCKQKVIKALDLEMMF